MGKLFKVPGGEYLVDSEDYEIRRDEFGRPILCPLNQGGGGEQPKLYAPEIKITGDTLTIIPNTDNGAFVTGYNGYMSVDGGDFELYGTLPSDQLELDLTAVGLPEGDFQFKATAIGTNFQDSDASNIEDYTNIFYTVTNTLINCTSDNSATSVRKGSAYAATLTASAGYTTSGATVTVTMGGEDITSTAYANGVITIAQLTGELVVTVSAAAVTELAFTSRSSPITNPTTYDNDVFFFNDKFFSMVFGQNIRTSTDGTTWTDTGVQSVGLYGTSPAYMAYDGNKYFLMCTRGVNAAIFYVSDNGINWTSASIRGIDSSTLTSIKGIKHFGDKIICYSNNDIYVLSQSPASNPTQWDWSLVERKIGAVSFTGQVVLCENEDYAFVFDDTASTTVANADYNVYVTTDLTNWNVYESALKIAVKSFHDVLSGTQIVKTNGKFVLKINSRSSSQAIKLFSSVDASNWQEISAYSQVVSGATVTYEATLVNTAVGVVLIPSDYQNKDKTTVRYAHNVELESDWKSTSLPVAVDESGRKLTSAYGAGKLIVFVKAEQYNITDA